MIDRLLSDPASAALTKSLQGASRRQEALANNIANIETPGYQRQDVHFEEALQSALESSSGDPEEAARALEGLEFAVTPDSSDPTSPDGNNVNIDHEMSELAKNSLRFDSSATTLALKIRMLRTAITEGRR